MHPEEAVSIWRKVKTEDISDIKYLSNGLSHKSYLLTIAGDHQQLVMKLFTRPQPHAINVQKWAASYSLAPGVIYSDQQHRFVIMQKVYCLQKIDVTNLARALNLLHTLPPPQCIQQRGMFNTLTYSERYLDKLIMLQHPAASELMGMLPIIQPILNNLNRQRTCVCHNDLVTENIGIRGSQIQLLDWEFAQLNSPLYDLASIIVYQSLTRQRIQSLLQYYDAYAVDYQKLNSHIAAVKWLDCLWRLLHLDLDLDQLPYWTNLCHTLAV